MQVRKLSVLAILLIAVFVPAHVRATPLIDLVADQVAFQQTQNGWQVLADYNVDALDTTADWQFSYTVKVYRGGNLLGTIGSGTIDVGRGATGCTIMCNGTCWVGDRRGSCYGGMEPCPCRTGTRLTATIASPQSGDVVVLELSTSEQENSVTNNSAQATF